MLLSLLMSSSISIAEDDMRELVQFPEMMQQHMMKNMRDHLKSIDEILTSLGLADLDTAAQIAEQRLGMSSLDSHNASHMAKFMPEGMRQAGISMHKAASRFALKAEEVELLPAYKLLSEITSACVSCHAAYRRLKLRNERTPSNFAASSEQTRRPRSRSAPNRPAR